MEKLLKNIELSPTAFHAVARAKQILTENGFTELLERDEWSIKKGGKYFVSRGDSSLIAFNVGDDFVFNIAAAHIDSCCLRVKGHPEMEKNGCQVLNTEVYGGLILNSFFDRKLVLAGRAFYDNGDGIESRLLTSPFNVVIPNLAVHINREVNNGVKINPQVDTCPVLGLAPGGFNDFIGGALSYDLFVASAENGFVWGKDGEFICSPRLDDLECAFGGLEAFVSSEPRNINVLVLFDSEEVGSRTVQSAGSTFLTDILKRIRHGLNKSSEDFKRALAGSMMLSLDNAHAHHPNHGEYGDPTTKTLMGGGVVIKYNIGYSTDGYGGALIRKLFKDYNVKNQEFFLKSDMRGGSTLGVISSGHLSITSVDIGLAQLAMHSAMECAAVSDYAELIKGLKAYFTNFKI